jgi:ubiquinone/menaquinone biosynthesis C-methylase UbiE
MARTRSNEERIRWTLSLLEVQPGDRILEIGFGPGIGVQLASEMAAEGFVVGVDHSEVMLRQASKRNAAAIRDGRVALRLGSASRLPSFDREFDKILTINSIHFWPDPVDCLTRMRGLLRSGGRIAVTLQPRSRGATDAYTRLVGQELIAKLELAGYTGARLMIREMKPVAAACAIATK